jgi:hypothetical protein
MGYFFANRSPLTKDAGSFVFRYILFFFLCGLCVLCGKIFWLLICGGVSMGRRDDDDREKLSWREIDNLRNRSRHVSDGNKSLQERSLKTDWARKQHLREADKFFLGKKGTETYKAAYASLHERYGTPQFAEALKDFIQEFGLPGDWGTLLLVLDTSNPEWIKQALNLMKGMYPQKGLLEQRGFKGKVKVLASTTKDRSLRQECEKILEEL